MRIALVVAASAAAAAAVAVGAAVLQSSSTARPEPRRAACPRGIPLVLDTGLRNDANARALRRAALAYENAGRSQAGRSAAGRLFARIPSLQARVGSAVAGQGAPGRLAGLARSHPRSAVVRLHLGLALSCEGKPHGAAASWRAAVRLAPDSPSAVQAGSLLHPGFAPGLPPFVPSFSPPRSLAALSPAMRFRSLRRGARHGGEQAHILYGIALENLGRPRSAAHEFALALVQAPNDVDAQVAYAVGLFDKSRPQRAFARLGPLSGRYPHSASVRFHLGLLLLWVREVDAGKRQLRLAAAAQPRSRPGREAKRFLAGLGA